jgi:DNA repair ATPase RecN
MWIHKLILTNFQKHSELTLDFTSRVNYIYGPSDAGKSCIRNAIGFLFFGEPSNDSIRKEETKQTSVKAILDNGIEVERIKSASINRYVITKEGNKQVYDSIGAKIPEDVQKILQTSLIEIEKETLNLNISEQVTLPFLLDQSASFRAKLFNVLTGNDLLDKIIQNTNKELLGIGREIKTNQEFVEVNTPKLNTITEEFQIQKQKLQSFNSLFAILTQKINVLKSLELLQNSLKTTLGELLSTETALQRVKRAPAETVERFKAQIPVLQALEQTNASWGQIRSDLKATEQALIAVRDISQESVDKLKKSIDKWIILDDLKEALDENLRLLKETESAIGAVKAPEMDTQTIRANIVRLQALQTLKKTVSDTFDQVQQVILNINDVSGNVKILDQKYKDLLVEAGCCPTCRQPISDKYLKDLHV